MLFQVGLLFLGLWKRVGDQGPSCPFTQLNLFRFVNWGLGGPGLKLQGCGFALPRHPQTNKYLFNPLCVLDKDSEAGPWMKWGKSEGSLKK